MAFTALFATAPIVLISIQVASRLLGEAARGGSLAGVLAGFVGPEIARTIQSLVAAARPHPGSSVPAVIINGAVLLYVAFFGFVEIQHAMNVMWGVQPRPQEPWWRVLFLRRLPDGRVPFRDLLLGSLATAIMWAAGTYVFELYLPRVDFSSVYGAAGSLVALLVWVNYMSQVVLLGAKFTRVLAHGRGEPVRPASYAAKVKQVLVEDQS